MYVIGLTFLDRDELPIQKYNHECIENTWINPENSYRPEYQVPWTSAASEKWVELKAKAGFCSRLPRTEDLMYRLLSFKNDIISRGHRILIYQQADYLYSTEFVDHPSLRFFKNDPVFVKGLDWQAIKWQFEQGATWLPEDHALLPDVRHVAPGQHKWINEFLYNYIQEYKILQ